MIIFKECKTESSMKYKGAVVITGSSGGAGKVTALALDELGYKVFACTRSVEEAEELKLGSSKNLVTLLLDFTNPSSIRQAVLTVDHYVGENGIAALINNATVITEGPIEFMALDDLRWVFEINVFGQVAMTQAFLPLIRRGNGRVISVGAIGSNAATPFLSPLSASRASLESITESLREELAPWKIPVVFIEPGAFTTLAVKNFALSTERTFKGMHPRSRVLYGEEYKKFIDCAIKVNGKGMELTKVKDVILKAVTEKRPKNKYTIGTDKIAKIRTENKSSK